MREFHDAVTNEGHADLTDTAACTVLTPIAANERRGSGQSRTIGSGRGFGPAGSTRKGRARRCFSSCVQAWARTFSPRARGNASPVCSIMSSVWETVATTSFGCVISGHVGDTRVLRVAA